MPNPNAYNLATQLLQAVADDPLCLTLTLPALLQRLAPHRHTIDFASVVWHGHAYGFTPAQRVVVKLLWEAWEAGSPSVGQETLLEAAGSESRAVADLFRRHECWGTMIVPGLAKGSFRLAD